MHEDFFLKSTKAKTRKVNLILSNSLIYFQNLWGLIYSHFACMLKIPNLSGQFSHIMSVLIHLYPFSVLLLTPGTDFQCDTFKHSTELLKELMQIFDNAK